MKIFLYVLGFLILAFVAAATWAYYAFPMLPPLEFRKGASLEEKAKITDEWFALLQKQKKFNGAVLIAKDGKAVLAKGYGYADAAKTRKITEHTSLRLASLSKQFTATGIMILNEDGHLSYDDLVSKYIVGFPYEGVTVRHLLNQTSGIPDVYLQLADEKKDQFDLLTNEIAVSLLTNEGTSESFATSGTKYEYSNADYILLARIIEVVSNQSLESFLGEHLFSPLGMSDSRVWNLLSEKDDDTNRADDLVIDEEEVKITKLEPTFIDGVAGDGAVFSSVSDLLKWDQFWYDDQLMPLSSKMKAFEKPILSNGKISDYGFGWMIVDDGMWHNGAWLGARTGIYRNTKAKTCTVILDNSSSIYIDDIVATLGRANAKVR